MGAVMGIMIRTTVLVMAILGVRKLSGEKLHVYIRYGLWLFVVLRLLIPVNFINSPVSVFRAVDAVTGKYVEASYAGGDDSSPLGNGGRDHMAIQELPLKGENESRAQELRTAGEDVIEEGPAIAAERNAVTAEHLPVREGASVFRWIWIAGSLFVGGTLCIAHLRFRRRLYRTRQLCRGGGERNVRSRRGMAKLCRSLPVYRVDKLEAPCLVGVLHPAVYIGTDIRTDTDRFRYVVTHEQVHYLHGDHIWALLRAVLVTVYWFNPLVWIAASVSARDGEIACDHGTIRRLGDKERLTYGEMLLDLSRKNCGRRIYSYGTMLRPRNSELKERISRLVRANGARLSAGIAAVVFMLALAGCAFTGTS
ncbi:MAG: M56 family metallopeptidase, partial [Lachnospiraceae bacterium]|nr:M56 family metallopeptidase [Lachnospiraceae bacterium]